MEVGVQVRRHPRETGVQLRSFPTEFSVQLRGTWQSPDLRPPGSEVPLLQVYQAQPVRQKFCMRWRHVLRVLREHIPHSSAVAVASLHSLHVPAAMSIPKCPLPVPCMFRVCEDAPQSSYGGISIPG